MARPLLRGDDTGWKEVRAFLEADVPKWTRAKPQDAYVVVTAVALAFNDAQTTGKLHPTTAAALDAMWARQRKTGEWDWIKCDWPPLEHDDYYGAVLAAVGVGAAPGKYAESAAAKAGVAKLRDYLRKTPPPDLHHRAMLLWASTRLDGLMTADERRAAVAELRKKQRADGGWALPALGTYKRRDGSANDPAAASDGYATGFAVYVLRQAGVPADDPAAAKGVAWLKANQRASGRWFTRSLNNDKAHYVTNAGTAFAVLALDACGETKVAAK
jgi:squalene-hopene/tetraprenyl-beta-curcumene cyclase